MFNNIITSIKRFFNIANVLDQSLATEADNLGKTTYVSEENLPKLQDAQNNLESIQEEKKKVKAKIVAAEEARKKALIDLAVEAEKEGITVPHNFSLMSYLQKGAAILAATAVAGFVLTELMSSILSNYKAAEKDKAFNERLYERLLNEEYEERRYIISLLEDKRRQKEIEASQTVVDLPSVASRIAPPPPRPVPLSPPPVPPPIQPPVPSPEPEPEIEANIPADIEDSVFEENSVPDEPVEKLSNSNPVLMVNDDKKASDVSAPISKPASAEQDVMPDLEPPPIPNIYGAPPKMDFSRTNFSLFGFGNSSITERALKALGLEKPMNILGTTVVTTIIIHYLEVALNEIHDLVVKRLANTGGTNESV